MIEYLRYIFIGIICTFAGIVAGRHMLWQEKPAAYHQWAHAQSFVHKPPTYVNADQKVDCSASNVQKAKEVIRICYKEKVRGF
jgi:hypothetical protein